MAEGSELACVDWDLFTEHLLVLDVSHGLLLFFNLIYLFLAAESSLLCTGFLKLWRAGAPL